jgi:hypothetical protein
VAQSGYTFVGEASTAGLLFLLLPAAGYLSGKWLGGFLGLGLVPAWMGAAAGLAAAFVNLLRLVKRASR